MQLHDLKCAPAFFALLWSEDKRFELRKDDRDYQLGDVLWLREWDERHGYSGRHIKAEVTCILMGDPWLKPGYVALGIDENERASAPTV